MSRQILVFNRISPSFSTKLDTTRAVAASMVALSHLRGGFFVQYNHLVTDSQNLFNYFLFFLTRLGHEAVIIFFVLSGYLVGGAILSEWMQGYPNWTKYLVNRITRMWIVLLPALLVGAGFDYITLSLNPVTPGAPNFTLANFIGNTFFLQTIMTQTFGTNAPLWSLANAFWYYLLWPAILIILSLKPHKFIKGLIAILFLSGCYILAPGIMKLFPLWIAGAVIRLIRDSDYFRKPIYIIFSYLFIAGSLVFSNITGTTVGEYLLGLAVCGVILGWQYSKASVIRPVSVRLAHFFSEFSFSLYTVHYFFMFLLFEVLRTYFKVPIRLTEAGIFQWLALTFLVLLTYGWAFAFYWFTERHTSTIRKYVLKRITR